jgi:hypothetical protein
MVTEVKNRVARLTTGRGVYFAWQSDYERFQGDVEKMNDETVLYSRGMSGWDDLRRYFEAA